MSGVWSVDALSAITTRKCGKVWLRRPARACARYGSPLKTGTPIVSSGTFSTLCRFYSTYGHIAGSGAGRTWPGGGPSLAAQVGTDDAAGHLGGPRQLPALVPGQEAVPVREVRVAARHPSDRRLHRRVHDPGVGDGHVPPDVTRVLRRQRLEERLPAALRGRVDRPPATDPVCRRGRDEQHADPPAPLAAGLPIPVPGQATGEQGIGQHHRRGEVDGDRGVDLTCRQ